jgi:hypothetical protein
MSEQKNAHDRQQTRRGICNSYSYKADGASRHQMDITKHSFPFNQRFRMHLLFHGHVILAVHACSLYLPLIYLLHQLPTFQHFA